MDLSKVTADVVIPVRWDPRGVRGPTRTQARGRQWRRTSQGFYVPASVDDSPPSQRIVEVAAALPEHAAITGWGSLNWRGARWFRGLRANGTPLPVPAWVGHDRTVRVPPRARLTEEWLCSADVEVVDGLRLTTAVAAASYEARACRRLAAAVVVLDMVAYDDLASLEELGTWLEVRGVCKRNVRRLRAAHALADENSWSPAETGMRILWVVDAGLPRPLCNVPLFDPDGRHLLTPDLFDPVNGVAGEYDGPDHLDRAAKDRDVHREELYRELALERVTMTAADWADPGRFLGRLRAAYRRAAERPSRGRRWCLEQPSWWRDTSTVERRRALSPDEQRLWLRRRDLP